MVGVERRGGSEYIGGMRKRHDPRPTPGCTAAAALPDVSRETSERLDAYAQMLLRWNRTINLVGRTDLAQLRQRHIDDCLRLVPVLPPAGDGAADLGSGAGLPGLVLAIATGRHFHLVESDERKAAFLAEAARLTQAPVVVHPCRIEAVALPPVALVTARALAPLSTLLGMAAPMLLPDGECLFLKGASAPDEIKEAREHWQFACDWLWRSRRIFGADPTHPPYQAPVPLTHRHSRIDHGSSLTPARHLRSF